MSGAEVAGRQVVVQQQLGNDWFTATSVASGADGSFSLALPTTWLHTTPVRVVVEETATALGAVSAATGVAVTPSWVPQGADREAWTQIDTRYRWRYDPCQSIEYRTNFAGAPNFARDALRSALAEITQATGHEFVHIGESNGIQNPEPGYPGISDDTELLIGFLRDEWTTNVYGETAIGRGGPDKGMWASDAKGAVNRITQGTAFLDLAPRVPWTPELMPFRVPARADPRDGSGPLAGPQPGDVRRRRGQDPAPGGGRPQRPQPAGPAGRLRGRHPAAPVASRRSRGARPAALSHRRTV